MQQAASNQVGFGDNNYRTEQKQIKRLNDALGSNDAVEPSVAKFLLEFCNHEIHTAVAFYKAQKNQAEQSSMPRLSLTPKTNTPRGSGTHQLYIAQASSRSVGRLAMSTSPREDFRRGRAQSCRNIATSAPKDVHRLPPQRHSSFNVIHRRNRHYHTARSSRPGDAKPMTVVSANSESPGSIMKLMNLDVAEAPTITTPPSCRGNVIRQQSVFCDYGALRSSKAQMRSSKSQRQGNFCSKAEGVCSSSMSSVPSPKQLGSFCASDRRTYSRSNGRSWRIGRHHGSTRWESSFHSSWKDVDHSIIFGCGGPSSMETTRPPTAGCSSSSSSNNSRSSSMIRNLRKPRNLSGCNLKQKDSSAKAA